MKPGMRDGYVTKFATDGWVLAQEALAIEVRQWEDRAAQLDVPTRAQLAGAASELIGTSAQFAGLNSFPFASKELSLLAVHRSILDLASALLDDQHPLMYQCQLWTKYGGLTDYSQTLHRDYAKNMVTDLSPLYERTCVSMMIYLSDIDHSCGPTALVSRRWSEGLPAEPARYSRDAMPVLYEHETPALGKKGTVLVYAPDLFHRATALTGRHSQRILLKVSFKRRDASSVSYHSPPRIGFEPQWGEFVRAASHRQLAALGFPEDPVETERIVQARYSDPNAMTSL